MTDSLETEQDVDPLGGQTPDRDQVVWRPSPAHLERSRLRQFLAHADVPDLHHLQAVAAEDPARYWGLAVDFLGLSFHQPFSSVVDLSGGTPWPDWFPDGGFNWVTNALDRHLDGPRRNQHAVIWEGDDGATRTWSYGELAEETNRLAQALRVHGVAKGDRVGIFLPMVPETVAAVLACGKIGAVFIPMFSGYGADALATRLRDSEATALITADGSLRRGRTMRMKAIADAALRECPDVQTCVVLRRIGEDVSWVEGRDVWWHDVVAGKPSAINAEPTKANDPYMIIYTSGTTGRPKGAVHVHAGFPIKATHDLAMCFDLHDDDTLFWLTDLGWMMGPWAIAGALMTGATLMIFEGTPDYPNPDRIWKLIEGHRVTMFGIAPTAIRSLMPHGVHWPHNHDLTTLRVLGSTGETWNPEPWQWYFDHIGGGLCPIINYSGGTETGGGIVGCTTIQPLKPCCFTGPVPGMVADVVDESGAPVTGAVGELVVRQPWVGMTQGFWGDAERYLETYWSRFPDTWVHGDWAEVDDDGFWFIRGRSDDTMNVAGKRIGPAEVESAAVAHPNVREAAAIGVPHPIKGEAVVVFIIPNTTEDHFLELSDEVRSMIGTRLGGALRPEAVHVVADLPRTRNAKIMRRVIRSAFLRQPAGDVTALENPGAVEAIAMLGAQA